MSKKKNERHIKRKQMIGFFIITLAFVFILVFVFPYLKTVQPVPVQKGSVEAVTPVFSARHPLTGSLISQDIELPQVYGVMIDNHPEARPQSGLDQAFLVIEAPVEGGISRLLAFFSAEQVLEEIGPVRSARPYFLDWNNELDALYVHVGGSDAALDDIATGGTLDLNQYWFGDSFWRAYDRYAPHNVYTSTERLKTAVEKRKNVQSPLYGIWTFKDKDETKPVETHGFDLTSFPASGKVRWVFDETMQYYHRIQGGKSHTVKNLVPIEPMNDSNINANNVVIVVTDVSILDAVGRRKIRTIGEGEALVFQDGQMIEATWRKESQSERLRFFDVNQNEIAFNVGNTWIEIIPRRSEVTILP